MSYLPGIIAVACIIGIPLLVVFIKFIKEMKEIDKFFKEQEAKIVKYLVEVHHAEPEMLEGLPYSVLCMIADGLDKCKE